MVVFPDPSIPSKVTNRFMINISQYKKCIKLYLLQI
jgi:hypothetical protein